MLTRLLGGTVRRWRPHLGWAISILLLIAVGAAVWGVVDADWVRGSKMFLPLSLVSFLLAALLAHICLPGWEAALLSGLGGLLYVTQALARWLPPPLGALRELWTGLLWLAYRLAGTRPAPPDWPVWRASGERLSILGGHLASWAQALFGGHAAQNAVAFLFVAGLILWAGASWAVWWTLRRGRPLAGLLPLGLALSMSTYLGGAPVVWVVVLAAALALLLPVVHLAVHEHRWERDGVDYSPEIGFDVWQVAVLATVLIVTLALVTPNLSLPRLVWEFWEFVQRPQEAVADLLTRFFGGVEPQDPPPLPAPREPGIRGPHLPQAALPRAHLVGGTVELTERHVMWVCIDAPPPPPEEVAIQIDYWGPQYYWRGTSYDAFDGYSWRNQGLFRQPLPAYTPIEVLPYTQTQRLRQHYIIDVPHGDTLYAVGEPHEADQPVDAMRRDNPAAPPSLTAPGDLAGIEGEIDNYVVWSEVPAPTVGDLRAAPPAAEPWLAARYLGLYDEIPASIVDLALEITAQAQTPYDRALAIEGYLRQFPYDLNVPLPPPGVDAVSFFLFDVQRGYCDYYASAFVVLARAAGLPARLAVGYAMGTYDREEGCYEVIGRDAHSWPEVYFSGYGWIPFEPTAPLSPFDRRPAGGRDTSEPMPFVPPPPRRAWGPVLRDMWLAARGRWQTYALPTAAGLLILLLALHTIREWRLSRLSPAEAVAFFYQDMAALGARLGQPRHPADTPAEYAVLLAGALQRRTPRRLAAGMYRMGRGSGLEAEARIAARQVRALSRAYEYASYAPRPPTLSQVSQARREWADLRRALRRLRLTTSAK